MYRIKEKGTLKVVTQQVVHDIVGRNVCGEYAIRLGCDKPIQWFASKYLKGNLDLNLLIKKQALDAGATVSPAIVSRDDNVNIGLYNEFCELYMSDTRDKKSPVWDGRWFYQGRAMRVVDKLLCRARMRDDKLYYLVEWGDRFKFKPSWIERNDLAFYIKSTTTAWQQFDASWDKIDNRKMDQNEIKHMELERNMFLGSCGGCDDIDRFLLGEDYVPMPTFDSDGHWCDDEEWAQADEGDERDEGDDDID